jgi:hypothetical protein
MDSNSNALTVAGAAMPDMRKAAGAIDPASVAGWGVDADPDNDPTYPMRDRTRDEGLRSDWERPPRQRPDVEILSSIEHIRLPAVVGTSTPPSGISGMIRRAAFKWSESHWAHWMLLMGADRINVVEGLVQDFGRARIPNIPAEMGIKAEWRHNKPGLARKAAAGAVVTILVLATMRQLKRGRPEADGRRGRPHWGRTRP